MASAASLSALLALFCVLSLCVSTVIGVSSRTTRSSDLSVLSTLDSEFSVDHYFTSHDVHHDTRSLWTRHKRAVLRLVDYRADPVPEDRTGMLFTVSSTVSDAMMRRFTLNGTSNLVTVDATSGNVYLANGSRLDYEDEEMTPLTVVIKATLITNPEGTGIFD